MVKDVFSKYGGQFENPVILDTHNKFYMTETDF